jgi:anti-sigma factor RsiW
VNCREAQGLLCAYIDEELDLVHSLDLEAHVRECASCAASLKRQEAVRNAVTAHAPYYAAPPSLRAAVERRAAAQFGRVERVSLTPWWSGKLMALAAACALAVVALVWWRGAPGSFVPGGRDVAREVVDSHVRSLMASHLVDVQSTDQHTVKPWFAGKLDFSPEVRDLSDAGFVLTGGRLDYVHSRTVAALVYKRRQHIINVFVWPAHEGTRGPRIEERDGYHVVSWVRGGMAWWAVSDLNAAELSELAGRL